MSAFHKTLIKGVLIILVVVVGYFIMRPQNPDEIRRELKGGWSLYLDCPNTVLNFVDERTVRTSACVGESGPNSQSIKKEGFYEIQGSTIIVTFDDRKLEFALRTKNGEKKLVLMQDGKQYSYFKIQDWEHIEKNWF